MVYCDATLVYCLMSLIKKKNVGRLRLLSTGSSWLIGTGGVCRLTQRLVGGGEGGSVAFPIVMHNIGRVPIVLIGIFRELCSNFCCSINAN
jgi:hypothetical protein